MNWFLVALISPVANAFVSYLDKYLIHRFVRGEGVGALVLFSSLFSVVTLPVLFFINPHVFGGLNLSQIFILLLSGILVAAATLFYLYALEDHEVSIVMPLAQLVPLFGFVLGFFFLGETITFREFWAATIILLGSLTLTLNLQGGTAKIKHRLIFYMIGATLCYALGAIVFKFAAVDLAFTQSLFWAMLGKILFGLMLLFFVKTYRNQFFQLLHVNKLSIMGLNVVNEILGIVAEVALVFALLLAPVVLVQSVSGLQPMFIFILGIIFTIWFPKFAKESLSKRDILQKTLGICIITFGIFLLELY